MTRTREEDRDNLKIDLERLIWSAKEALNAVEYDSVDGLKASLVDASIWYQRALSDTRKWAPKKETTI